MKETNGPQKGKGMARRKRWIRNADGTYRYVGVCPFNRTVCGLINVMTKRKARQEEG
jgi:hypothetical protein